MVLYTYIDGVYYMSIAEMVTETVDARGINSKTETMTCNGTDYVQSHIGYTDESEYYYDVTDAHTRSPTICIWITSAMSACSSSPTTTPSFC